MNKNLIVPIILLTIIVGGGLTLKRVEAEGNTDHQTSLVQQFVARFGLKESEVRSVFEEARTERQTEMRNRFEERLSQLVTDMKITEAQKKLIIDKQNAIRAKHLADAESLKKMTPEQRKAFIDKEQADLKAWTDSNGIDVNYLSGWEMQRGMGIGKGRGMRGIGHGSEVND